MILTGEVKFVRGDLMDFLVLPCGVTEISPPCGATGSLLPCGAAGSSGFHIDAISIVIVLRGAKKFLVETNSTGRCCGRASE